MDTPMIMSSLLRGLGTSVQKDLGRLKPRWLWFGVTDKCNSRCVYCNIWKMKPCPDPLTPSEIEIILSNDLFKNIQYVLNSGGEPVMRTDIKDVFAVEHKVLPDARLQLSTNGIMVDSIISLVQFALEDLGCHLDVGVSLDGVGENHDSTRGIKGNFERVNRLLHELQPYRETFGEKLQVTVGATLTDQTVKYAHEAWAYAKSLNIPFMLHWFNQSEFYGNVSEKSKATAQELKNAIQTYLPCSLYRAMWLKSLESGSPLKFNCFALHTFCVLKCNGDISPCLSLWDTVIGNARKTDPTIVWNSYQAKMGRKAVSDCAGCLNNWGVNWSLNSSYFPILSYSLKRRIQNID